MAALDLSDLGIRVTLGRTLTGADGRPVSQEFDIDASPLVAALDRVSRAAEELRAAWEALPPEARRMAGDWHVTLHAEPQGDAPTPDPGEPMPESGIDAHASAAGNFRGD